MLVPTQGITILGFVINSRKMEVKLTPQKEKNRKRLLNRLFSMKNPSSTSLAKVIVTIVSVLQQSNMLPCTTEHQKILKTEL